MLTQEEVKRLMRWKYVYLLKNEWGVDDATARRLVFARWLVEQGRLFS